MGTSSSSTEMEIISAAIECIEKYGIQKTTNRKIAGFAGVNVAAINYYFRSKDRLIERCMQVTLENAFDFKDFDLLPGNSARERCTAIFNELLAGGLKYPGLSRSHFYDIIAEGRYNSLAVMKINDFIHNLVKDLEGRGGTLDHNELQVACVQITSAIMMVILAPKLFLQGAGIDINDENTRKQFVERLVERLL